MILMNYSIHEVGLVIERAVSPVVLGILFILAFAPAGPPPDTMLRQF
jgi:hypothetical protein